MSVRKTHIRRNDVAVPPARKLSKINWPPRHGKANPAKHFLTTDEIVYSGDVPFRKDLKAQLAACGGG